MRRLPAARLLAAAIVMGLAACQALPSTPGQEERAGMKLIPAGDFLMGSPEGSESFSDERPQRRVSLRSFWIDAYEVTNADYERFVLAAGHRPPANLKAAFTLWDHGRPRPDSLRHPVVNVSWHDAQAYCRWAGKRLPTEAEWEKAARGTDGRLYPWGNEWHPMLANSASYWAGETVEFQSGAEWKAFWMEGKGAQVSKERGLNGEVLTLPVGSFPDGASPYGLFDMAGNASEWVQDWFEPYYYLKAPAADPQGPEGILLKVVRGGSWLKPAKSLRAADRDYGYPDDRPSGTGFRCARDEEKNPAEAPVTRP